jgi:hypothetical protein
MLSFVSRANGEQELRAKGVRRPHQCSKVLSLAQSLNAYTVITSHTAMLSA